MIARNRSGRPLFKHCLDVQAPDGVATGARAGELCVARAARRDHGVGRPEGLHLFQFLLRSTRFGALELASIFARGHVGGAANSAEIRTRTAIAVWRQLPAKSDPAISHWLADVKVGHAC